MASSPPRFSSASEESSAGPSTPPLALSLNLEALKKGSIQDETPASAKTVRPSGSRTTHDLPEIPQQLRDGVSMLKVSAKKVVQRRIRIAPEVGQVFWESRTGGVLNIESIRELRFGADARGYREALGRAKDTEARWTSVIYASSLEKKIKVLHLVALTADAFVSWKTALSSLYEQRRALMGGLDQMRRRQSVWLNQHWKMADAGNDGRLDFSEVLRLCNSLGIAAHTEELRRHFDESDIPKTGYLDFPAFQAFVRCLKRRPEIEQLLKAYAGGAASLTSSQFVHFLRKAQHSSLSEHTMVSLFRKYCDRGESQMSVEAFASFLLSSDNNATTHQANRVSHDMTRPLCEYFISSSHNTYLVGNQLKGESTTEGYIRALQQGCRTVEMDVWDGPNGQPVVYHGRTLTTKVTAHEVLLAIAKYAFVASPYPVILSMELHCNVAQQQQLTRTLKETLGMSLVDQPLRGQEVMLELPCPEELKYRFLVKAKNVSAVGTGNLGPLDDTLSLDEGDISSSSASSDASDLRNKLGSALRRFRSNSSSRMPQMSPPSPALARTSVENTSNSKLDAGLAALLVYTVGVKCRGFNKKEQYAPHHILSLSERRASKMIKDTADELIAHNRNHLMRAYPSVSRFTSSNFLPHTLWAVGVQMVAINWQTFDLGAEINAAMFQRNAKSGYVLKPEVLRVKGATKDKDLLASPVRFALHIKIISAQQLSKSGTKDNARADKTEVVHSRMDPAVEAAIYAPGQSSAPHRRTAVVPGNGFNPVFSDNSFVLPFEVIGGVLDLAFLRLQVFDEDEDVLGRYTVPLGSLAYGYRHVPLYDSLGQQYLFSSLFIYSRVERIS